MKTLEELTSGFTPSFEWTDDLGKCADMINLPHEDYPLRVGSTINLITNLVEVLQESGLTNHSISNTILCTLHSLLFSDYNPKNILVGSYRLIHCGLENGHTFIDPVHIHEYMNTYITDLTYLINLSDDPNPEELLIMWYSAFQSIHPFQDGNGRIGGIVVAALSYMWTGRYLAPLQ